MVRRDHYCSVPWYEGEIAEEMMHNGEAGTPMRVWDDSLKYILYTIAGKVFHLQPKDADLKRIHQRMAAYAVAHCASKELQDQHLDGIADMQMELDAALRDNYGLYRLMVDGGAESLSFARFPVSLVPRAIALESAYLVNYNNANVYGELAPGCLSMRYGVYEPIYVHMRERSAEAEKKLFKVVPKLKQYRDTPAPQKLATIVVPGAGLLLELRKFGLTLAQIQSLNIIACDMDESMLKELDVVFRHDFGVPFSESGIEYRICSIKELLKDWRLFEKADMVLMDGIMSYYPEKDICQYLCGARRVLKPGGVLCCDLQVLEISLLRCAIVHGWVCEPRLNPELSAKRAIKKMRRIVKEVGGFEMWHQVDLRNPRPIGVIFHLRKSE